jgi:hypothetical protein
MARPGNHGRDEAFSVGERRGDGSLLAAGGASNRSCSALLGA